MHLGKVLLGALALGLHCKAYSDNIQQEYEYRSIPVPVSHLYDNVATEDFDGRGASYAVENLPTGQLENENIQFVLPKWGNGLPDNFVSNEQRVTFVDSEYIREFHILYAGDWIDGETGAEFEFEFVNDDKQVVQISVKNWWNIHWLNNGLVKTPYHDTPNGRNYNITQLHHWSTAVSSFSRLKSIRFPPKSDHNRLHVFAITLVPAYAPADDSESSPAISVKNVRLTTLTTDKGDSIVQVTLANLRALAFSSYEFAPESGFFFGHSPRRPHPGSDQHILNTQIHNDVHNYKPYTSAILSGLHEVIVRPIDNNHGVRTVSPGKVFRLMPGDDARVDVGVTFDFNSNGIIRSALLALKAAGRTVGLPSLLFDWISTPKTIQVEIVVVSTTSNSPIARSTGWDLDLSYATGLANGDYWESTRESLVRHETPRWWNNAKFGIFIHWGIYSVPGWVPKGYYEEWYNWWLHNPPDESNVLWRYHRDTHGDKLYDHFIPEFNGAKFNASEWVDLFAIAGAKYFVLVTKHHDGFALFDTHDSTHRSSVHLGPKRDFIREIMNAARERHPSMRKGTYYSMPEWFNPDAGPYGFGSWPGQLARGAYNHSLIEPYTGRLKGKDYLRDIQMEHMRILAEEYETEIMASSTLVHSAETHDDASCPRAFTEWLAVDTPEYARFNSIQTHSWETSEGIDPYSYGYNRDTKDKDYRSAKTIIHTLVDIVSKNGNYLLNLGPTGEGEIIPVMVERLVKVGKWLGHSGECIYDTTYSFLGAEVPSLRFTTTATSFCIILLSKPDNGILVVDRPVPILPGDTITLLGAKTQDPLAWSYRDNKLVVVIPNGAIDGIEHAWAFKINFGDAQE
ncbi:Alpha-L-fucosidase [Ceratobasidium theobromae]|uniref:alpha-L-fucosidase n=1 Tax=Ceratobasidium theobromae TaxID=1582974 RepID=A0A5N5QCC5_9AGAM|nr:Alpha-L-fucosidase [Ceratobasidium theobromae]